MDNFVWKREITEESVKHLSKEQVDEMLDKLFYLTSKVLVEYEVGIQRWVK